MASIAKSREAKDCSHHCWYEVCQTAERETVIVCRDCGSVFKSIHVPDDLVEKSGGCYRWLEPGESFDRFVFTKEEAAKFEGVLVN